MKPGRLLGVGRRAEVYAWQNTEALKLFYPGASRASVEREAEKSRIVSALGAPSPKTYDVVEIDGRYGIIFEKVSGPTMQEAILGSPHRTNTLARHMADLHYAIHQIEADSLVSVHSRLERSIRDNPSLPQEAKDKALDILSSLPKASFLCHMDMHPKNVILSHKGLVAIDWDNACCGHSLADVSRTLLVLSQARHHGRSVVGRKLNAVFSRIVSDAYRTRYLSLTPYQPEDLGRWMLPQAAARLNEGVTAETSSLMRLMQNKT